MSPLVLTAAIGFIAAVVLVRLVIAIARRRGAIVNPSDDRWGDRRVPKIGGLGIVGAILIACLVAPGFDLTRLVVVVGALAASALGLADDLGSVSPRRRVAVQAFIGLAIGAIVGRNLEACIVAMAILGLIGVVALANFTNLVDNADGLAASLSTVSALTIAGIGLAAGSSENSVVVAVAVAGSALGFLAWNRPAARVFMGDSGSLMLGTALAGAGLIILDAALVNLSSASLVVLALPIAVVVQAGDVALVIVSRVRRGSSPMNGGVDHTSHRLLRAGFGPWQMLAACVVPAALAGAAIVAAVRTGSPAVVEVAATAIIGLVIIGEATLARLVPYPPAADPATTGLAFIDPDPSGVTEPMHDPVQGAGDRAPGRS